MDEGLELFDSNVLIAALVSSHANHAPSNARLSAVIAGGGACGAHSLAEIYSNLTKYPRGYGIPANDAVRLIEEIGKFLKVIALSPAETHRAIQNSARHGISGAMIYDALLIACARKIGARVIYTSDVRHFRRIAPDLASRIVEP